MKRIVFIAALVAAIAAPQAFAAGGFHNTVAAAQKVAKEKNRLIFVDLFADWCGWCHRFDKEVVPSEAFQKSTDDMVLLRLDTEDGKEGTEFSRRYGVTSLPTFVILTPDLALAATLRGYAPPTQFAAMINEGLKKHRDFEEAVAREGMLAKDYQKRLDLAREFRTRHAWSEAEKRFRKLTSEPGVPVNIRDGAYYDLGVLYLQQKKHEQVLNTVKEFAKVQRQGDLFEQAKFLIPQVYLDQGKIDAALNELNVFKATYPKSKLMPMVESTIAQLKRLSGQ